MAGTRKIFCITKKMLLVNFVRDFDVHISSLGISVFQRPSRVLHCDTTGRAFENTGGMKKTRGVEECILHFFCILKCP